ncbi:hypothetical protein ISN44_As06g033880 [Arabidopsis suecica]|uniref:Uncharacterized protein n=1 Tax=Arabidopsis suecica TaxID=45249 RepID=A0A8T2CQP0_ARASU|nr:hypothetical protein ISN44_As06g033880 [Arabidopsis suecica]
MIQFKQKVLPQAQLLRWASWFSQWKFDVKHIKGNDNFLPDFLSRTQRQISAIVPMILTLSPENPTENTLRNMIASMPQGLQEKMLDNVLIYRGIETLHGFLKLYIYRYGLDQGPLLGLPYHPVYPFLTTINLNPVHYGRFPIEAYLVLWYLVDLYTIGVLVHKKELLQYLAKCILTRRKNHYKILYKWLTLFNNVTWWQEQIRAQQELFILVTFKITTVQNQEENGVTIKKLYEAHVQTSYNNDVLSQSDFHQRAETIAALNGLDVSDLDIKLFCPHTSH